MEYAKLYAQIQQLRFSDRLTLYIDDLPEGTQNITVPKLILQPLIENAYEHGINSLLKDAVIHVRFCLQEDDTLEMIIEDNGDGITDERIAELQALIDSSDQTGSADGVALMNIQKRLQLFYGNGSRLVLGHSQLRGLQAKIVLKEVSAHVARIDSGR